MSVLGGKAVVRNRIGFEPCLINRVVDDRRQGDEIHALRRLQRKQEASPYVFTSERGGPMTAKSFGTLFARLGERAGLPFTIFPHMLRHACGYKLANDGHDTRAIQHYLGHRSIASTVRYTALAPDRFRNFWRD